ncbi:MAG: TRAP transporter small permease [Salinarimonadaceae bacterium]|nr:MAG: TRAP transporter small permease [Salinarimonadaceae bacterium]
MTFAARLRSLSDLVASIDRKALIALVAALLGLVLANVGTRLAGYTIAWADELAVYCMVWAGFVGAALMLRARTAPAVSALIRFTPPRAGAALRAGASLAAALFGALVIWTCWRWFDPVGIVSAGFDVTRFEAATFNFIYTQTTPVMGLPSVIFYAVLPWFGFGALVHATTNLLEDCGLLPRIDAADSAVTGEG